MCDVISFLDQVQQVDDPPPATDLLFERREVDRLGGLGDGWDADPRLTLLRGDLHATRGALTQRRVQPVQRRGVPALQVGDELLRVAGLGQRLVVDVAVILEIRWEIVFGVAPTAWASLAGSDGNTSRAIWSSPG